MATWALYIVNGTSLRDKFPKVFAHCAMFSQVVASFLDLLGPAGTCSDVLRCIQMPLDAFGCIRKSSENAFQILMFAPFGKFLNSYAKTDVTGRFFVISCSGRNYLVLNMTLGS